MENAAIETVAAGESVRVRIMVTPLHLKDQTLLRNSPIPETHRRYHGPVEIGSSGRYFSGFDVSGVIRCIFGQANTGSSRADNSDSKEHRRKL